MTGREADLLAASRREHALYRALLAAYAALETAVTAPAGGAEAAAAMEHGRREAERIVSDLQEVQASLRSIRSAGEPVAPEVVSWWRASAELAEVAAQACHVLADAARTRQAALRARLDALAGGRRGLSGYRPPHDGRGAIAEHRA